MGDIRQAIPHLPEPDKSIAEILIEYYETMKKLESDSHRGGKQATKIVMTISDIQHVFKKENTKENPIFKKLLGPLSP